MLLMEKTKKNVLTKILGWLKSKVSFMPSFRFLKNKTSIKKNSIYLPLNVRDTLIVLECLKFLDNNNYVDLTKFKVKKHPSGNYKKKY